MRVKKSDNNSTPRTPALTIAEIDFHYDLVKSGGPIDLKNIHPVLKEDLLLFLIRSKKLKLIGDMIPLALYKAWIKKINTKGLNYKILLNKTR